MLKQRHSNALRFESLSSAEGHCLFDIFELRPACFSVGTGQRQDCSLLSEDSETIIQDIRSSAFNVQTELIALGC